VKKEQIRVGPKVADLISAIATADITPGPVTRDLRAGRAYEITKVNKDWYGPDGLPPIDNKITIVGHGAIIERSTAAGTPDFRFFYVSGGAELAVGSLTLVNVTLRAGIAQGGNGAPGAGGGLGASCAIFNQS
jgi:hypothetical protein